MNLPSENLNLDIVRKRLLEQNLGDPFLEAKKSSQEREEEEKQQLILKRNIRTCEGFQVLLKELFRHAKDGMISLHDEIESVALADCLLKGEGAEILKDPHQLKNYLEAGGTIPGLHNFSIPVMLTFYQIAKNLTLDKRQNDAVNAFTYLCQLNPQVPPFWIGLGITFEEELNWNEAIESYQTAIAQDPLDFDSYIALMRCCKARKDYAPAKELLTIVLQNEEVKNRAQDALNYIQEQEGSK